MPNTGKPSKDCHECRKRRVKVGATSIAALIDINEASVILADLNARDALKSASGVQVTAMNHHFSSETKMQHL